MPGMTAERAFSAKSESENGGSAGLFPDTARSCYVPRETLPGPDALSL
jgi:hypothetical protein